MKKSKSPYHGFHFPAAIISCAVRWYFRFNLSPRDIEELLLERGVSVTYETILQWYDRFGAQFARRAKAERNKARSTWALDEMFVCLRGEPYVVWRAVDEHGTELDVLLQKRRDKAAAKRFIRRVLRSNPAPRRILTSCVATLRQRRTLSTQRHYELKLPTSAKRVMVPVSSMIVAAGYMIISVVRTEASQSMN
ncbi:transposase-like protein [Paraburkholderia sp. UCT70]